MTSSDVNRVQPLATSKENFIHEFDKVCMAQCIIAVSQTVYFSTVDIKPGPPTKSCKCTLSFLLSLMFLVVVILLIMKAAPTADHGVSASKRTDCCILPPAPRRIVVVLAAPLPLRRASPPSSTAARAVAVVSVSVRRRKQTGACSFSVDGGEDDEEVRISTLRFGPRTKYHPSWTERLGASRPRAHPLLLLSISYSGDIYTCGAEGGHTEMFIGEAPSVDLRVWLYVGHCLCRFPRSRSASVDCQYGSLSRRHCLRHHLRLPRWLPTWLSG
ncbi:hypothetical protein GW17_00019328 [Ensete ventricosum]|nr:hypothetical protein GW17_00019328 [Ensete ventricosum]